MDWLAATIRAFETVPTAIWVVLVPAFVLAVRAREGRIVSRIGHWLMPVWLAALLLVVGREAEMAFPGMAFAIVGALVAGVAAGFLLAFPARIGADHQWGLLRIGGSLLPLAGIAAAVLAMLAVYSEAVPAQVLATAVAAMGFASGAVTGRVLGHDLKARRTEHVDLMALGKAGRFLSRL